MAGAVERRVDFTVADVGRGLDAMEAGILRSWIKAGAAGQSPAAAHLELLLGAALVAEEPQTTIELDGPLAGALCKTLADWGPELEDPGLTGLRTLRDTFCPRQGQMPQ